MEEEVESWEGSVAELRSSKDVRRLSMAVRSAVRMEFSSCAGRGEAFRLVAAAAGAGRLVTPATVGFWTGEGGGESGGIGGAGNDSFGTTCCRVIRGQVHVAHDTRHNPPQTHTRPSMANLGRRRRRRIGAALGGLLAQFLREPGQLPLHRLHPRPVPTPTHAQILILN
jgi:hypothetical protein